MLLQAVGVNKVAQHVLDERARNVLKLVNRCAESKIPENAEEKTGDTLETAAFLRKIGAESIVLMKNNNDILPLKKDKKVSFHTRLWDMRLRCISDTGTGSQCKGCNLPWRWISFSSSILRCNPLRRHLRPTHLSASFHAGQLRA